MSNKTKATVEEEEDAATVGGYHGYPVLMRTDMSEEMAYEVMEVCISACEKYINDKRNNGLIAKNIKDALDSRYLCGGGPSAWHVVVGERYSFEIVYEVSNLLYMFFSARLAICVWKI